MAASLTVEDFSEFFSAVNPGQEPYPWQRRLVEEVAASGRWPSLLDLPTGAGKTAAIDAAVFLLALDAARPPPARRFPRRIVMVVDRRVLVDQAGERASALRGHLMKREAPVVAAVADALVGLGGDPPLVTTVLRGGMVRDDGWAQAPDQPAVIISTVDQVGSRLLFRGYGLSHRMAPVHAGLLGNDCLFLLDEVHLSQPFAETLAAVDRFDEKWRERPLPRRWQVVALSATPGERPPDAFTLGEADRDPARCVALPRRLAARKPVATREVKVRADASADDAAEIFAGACAQAAADLLKHAQVRTVAVMVNRVDTARRIHRLIADAGTETVLFTGRMRPLDRDDLMRTWLPHLRSGRQRDPEAPARVVVATQCLEAGADFDFDGLVTECASLDALRQRFGRLDRAGTLTEAGTPAPGIVLARSDQVRGKTDDPVYGGALAATWRWLNEGKALDFGPEALALPEGAELAALLAPRERAPVLLPAHLDAWVQTSPVPAVDPEVAQWLHGPERRPADVQIVWRADLTRLHLTERPEEALEMVAACPPGSGEAISVPLAAARAWLAGAPVAPVADVEGDRAVDTEARAAEWRPFLVWRGDDSKVPDRLFVRPGDTLVVPAEYGGLRDGSWDPTSTAPVTDLGDTVQFLQRGRPTLRLHPAVLGPLAEAVPFPGEGDGSVDADRASLAAWLSGLADRPEAPAPLREAATVLRRAAGAGSRLVVRRFSRVVTDGGEPAVAGEFFALVDRVRHRSGETSDFDGGDRTSSFTGVEVTLTRHLDGVGAWAQRHAEQCGLPPALADDLGLAGRLHDLGKLDARFQLGLCGGDEVRLALGDEPLAKSAMPAQDRAAREAAWARSGYPRGMRHELLSLALVQAQDAIKTRAQDWDLVQHLVASHHGFGRPLFFEPVVDPAPQSVDGAWEGVQLSARTDHGLDGLGSPVGERFWRLVQRYGWWGLAWLEALLRLADHRQSEAEQREAEQREAEQRGAA